MALFLPNLVIYRYNGWSYYLHSQIRITKLID
jgi:hypothetical protein